MLWLAWRQVRAQTWITVTLLVAAAITLTVTGIHLASLWRDSGAAACHAACTDAVGQFLYSVRTGRMSSVYDASTIVAWVVPPLFGLFWGAPLVARELEAGTHRLAWNQSVSRTRWLLVKLAFAALAAAVTMTVLVAALAVWAHHLDRGSQLAPKLFGVRGTVPAAYAIFAVLLGATAGILMRRTVPAMAATLAGYVLVVAAMPLWIREHLLPVKHAVVPLDVNRIMSLRTGPGMPIELTGEPTVSGWILSNHTVTASGQPFHAVADAAHCGQDSGMNACAQWIATLDPHESLTYHPLSSFWSFQLIETAIFLALAAVLAVVCFARLRRIN